MYKYNSKSIKEICSIESGDGLYRTMKEIVAIGSRRHGTDEEKNGAKYLLKAFENAGLEDVAYEIYHIPSFRTKGQRLEVLVDGKCYDIPCGSVWLCGAGDVTAEVYDIGYGLCDEDKWAENVQGKVVFMRSNIMANVTPMHDAIEPCVKAYQSKAAALVLATDFPYDLRTRYVDIAVEDADVDIPCVIISGDDRRFVEELLRTADGSAKMRVICDCETYMDQSGDVVGYIHGTDDYLFLICHYDSTDCGATDNASAEAAFIKTAEKLVNLPKPHPTIVFVGHSGHESFHGTKTFVKRHLEEVKKGFLCINYDGMSSPGHFRSECGIVPSGQDDYKLVAVSNNPVLIDIAIRSMKDNVWTPCFIIPQDEITAEFANGDSEGAFAKYGVPIMGAGSHNVWYHTVYDTIDKTTPDHLYRSYNAQIDMVAYALEKGPDAIRNGMVETREEAISPFVPENRTQLKLCQGDRGVLFGIAPSPAKVGERVQMYYMLVVDSKEVIVDYTWDFGDGTRSKDIFTDHIYTQPGRYKVRFSCIDTAGYEFGAERNVWIYE